MMLLESIYALAFKSEQFRILYQIFSSNICQIFTIFIEFSCFFISSFQKNQNNINSPNKSKYFAYKICTQIWSKIETGAFLTNKLKQKIFSKKYPSQKSISGMHRPNIAEIHQTQN
jgi:hypothetical protein